MDVVPSSMLGQNPPAAVTEVCKNFFSLSDEQQRVFWAYLFQAISVPESSMDPYNRYVETGISGVDGVTGMKVVSEGLLQLSYQDALYTDPMKLCKFDWSRDKSLAATDHSKTIFDPKTNLECGVSIMSYQLKKKATVITHGKAYYWSTLNDKAGNDGYVSFQQQMKNAPGFCGN